MIRLKQYLKKFEFVLSDPCTKLKLYSIKSRTIKKILIILIDIYKNNRFFTRFKNFLTRKSYIKKAFVVLNNELNVHGLFNLSKKHKRFQGDIILGSLIDCIIKFFEVSSFIETGSHLGATSSVMANLYPDLAIFTCEVNRNFYEIAKEELKKYKNILIENKSSNVFLLKLIRNKKISNTSIFFLDAHWYDFWPLQTEVELISTNLNKAIYIIHDFEVPNRPQYHYIHSKSRKNRESCNLTLIENKFNKKNQYNFLFPRYGKDDAKTFKLVGHVVIFQNLSSLFNKFLNKEFIQNNYFEYKNS